jgi:vacuolar-type H+-ATPase subunit H
MLKNMNESMKEKMIQPQNPQRTLEKILSAEIDVASKISDARERADRRILEAQNNLNDVKTNIVENARIERDQMIEDGIKDAHEKAEKTIGLAKKEADAFVKNGDKYLEEAADLVLRALLGSGEVTK